MKNRNTEFTAILVALAFALTPIVQGAPRPDGGPIRAAAVQPSSVNSEAGAQFGMPDNILPVASFGFAPIGLTMSQTARLNLINMDVANGIIISYRFIDASGVTLAQSSTTLALGNIVSIDYKRHSDPNSDAFELLRAEVRVQVDIFTGDVSSESLRQSLEVFNNDTGATTVFMGGAGP